MRALRAWLAALPVWPQILVATAASLLMLPWLVRFYGWYWDVATGRLDGLAGLLMPVVR